jgi:hypothetical protein
MLPGFDENGKVIWHAGGAVSWYPAFAVNPTCSRCGDEKVIGECHEHVDCLTESTGELRHVCPKALKSFRSAWNHDCDDEECAAVLEARRILAEEETRKPGYQLVLL